MPEPTSPRRHVALYVPDLEGGGAERVTVMLANSFARSGHRVDLVLVKATGPYLSEVSKSVRIVDLRSSRVLTSLLPLRRYIRQAHPDVLLSALNHSNIVAIMAKRLSGLRTRLVVSEHNSVSQGVPSRGAKVMRALIRRYYPAADAIVCVSEGIRKQMAEQLGLPPTKLHCIYNPLDVDRIRALKDLPIDHPWLATKAGPIIVAAGRLTEQKDYPTLLQAVARLPDKLAARLVILGQGDDETMLKKMAADLSIEHRVSFMGFQSNPFAWMNNCDVYALSSRWEGLPGTLLEALACNARIVSTDCPTGPREILEDGKWGQLVPVGDPEALAAAIERALDRPAHPNGAQRADEFRPERAAANYAAVMHL